VRIRELKKAARVKPLARLSLNQPIGGTAHMIIDRETFTELAVHLKLASDAVLATARHLAVLSNGDNGPDEHWAGTLDSLMNMNTEITVMERILRALMEANREEELSTGSATKKSEPLPS
jgi:hypothetical protein